MEEELDYDNGPGSEAFNRKTKELERAYRLDTVVTISKREKPKKPKEIKSSKDIVVGQFYKTKVIKGYYYVGVLYGENKRLAVINMPLNEAEEGNEKILFLGVEKAYKLFHFVECSQEEAMKEYK